MFLDLPGMVRILYETRLGAFKEGTDPDAEKFIESVHNIFQATFVTTMPPFLRKTLFRKYDRYNDEGWSNVFEIGQRMIDAKLKDIRRDLDEGRQVKGFLASLLTNDNFNVQDIYANVSELMFAGVDTVSGVFGAVVCL